jgi:hypothetical protein
MENREVSEKEIIMWLRAYNGKQHFYYSLKYQLQKKGYLTPKQADCVRKAILSGAPVEKPDNQIENPTYAAGTVLVMKEPAANGITRDFALPFSFHSIEVVKTHKETEKGIQLTFLPRNKRGELCEQGREVTTWVSRWSLGKEI